MDREAGSGGLYAPNRRAALAVLAAAIGASAAPAAAAQPLSPPTTPDSRLGPILVLSGGGARGAYEAGVIEGLVRKSGVRDGQPIPGVDAVVGTSIGAINGWFVATAQYSALRTAWQTISAANIFRLKRRYAAMAIPSAGVGTRLMESLSLLVNLNKTMDGIFDAAPVKAWLRANVDPQRRPLVPLIFNAADIRNQRAAYFYSVDAPANPVKEQLLLQALDSISGIPAKAQAAQAILHDALYASIALPLLFDPIELVVAGVPGLFVDGGSSDNTAVDVARILGPRVNVVLVDPPTTSYEPTNAITAALGSFNLLQRRVLEASLRNAYATTLVKKTFATATVDAAQRAFLDGLYDVELGILRPKNELPGDLADFQDQVKLQDSYDQGVTDAGSGWSPYVPPV
jgi:predicted acylesterase/phospholipase RssA